jgi:hypothetical protein
MSDAELIEAAFLVFGKNKFLSTLNLSVLLIPEKKVRHHGLSSAIFIPSDGAVSTSLFTDFKKGI